MKYFTAITLFLAAFVVSGSAMTLEASAPQASFRCDIVCVPPEHACPPCGCAVGDCPT
ncbi:hypothetical protein JAAARDRAFT_504426 [Jaapia argillacea MUCL 33604]|uniref:4Fe-4S ferredoxin-type domain-containing protein n=1 Tax=Jaapia argillacea MUCL 33604 TaxID=933084 RepID=A0A067P9X9_9AGAM|nr:hypothetical protein JAAARDRAFT_504426 [Jaapia argillacea MUCL 33604]